MDELKIKQLNLNYWSKIALKNAGIKTIDQLCSYSITDLHNIDGLGDISIKNIRDSLAKHGLSLSTKSRWNIDGHFFATYNGLIQVCYSMVDDIWLIAEFDNEYWLQKYVELVKHYTKVYDAKSYAALVAIATHCHSYYYDGIVELYPYILNTDTLEEVYE